MFSTEMDLILMKVSKRKLISAKKSFFDLVNGDFGHWGPPNDQPSDQMTNSLTGRVDVDEMLIINRE